MPYNLLLLPLIGGYFFTHYTYRFRFRAYGLSNYRLLLEAAFFGLIFGGLSIGLTRLLQLWGCLGPLEDVWKLFFPFEYSGAAAGSLAIAGIASWAANEFWDIETSKEIVVERHADVLVKFFYEAMQSDRSVMLTLSDRKFYVGYVVLDQNFRSEMPYITLVPSASGYREKDTLVIKWTVSYAAVHYDIGTEQILNTKEDFAVLVPISQIVSARLFDYEAYDKYFEEYPEIDSDASDEV